MMQVTVTLPYLNQVHFNSLETACQANARKYMQRTQPATQIFLCPTVTNQVVNTFVEVGLPFIIRRFETFRKDKAKAKSAAAGTSGVNSNSSAASDNGSVKKRVVFEDEKERDGLVERQFLDSIREEAALPEYDLFADYSEMVIQFGNVVLWSTIWPLVGGNFTFLQNFCSITYNPISSYRFSEQPPRTPLGCVQDAGTQRPPCAVACGHDRPMARCAHIPHLARRTNEFGSRVPLLAPTPPYCFVLHKYNQCHLCFGIPLPLCPPRKSCLSKPSSWHWLSRMGPSVGKVRQPW